MKKILATVIFASLTIGLHAQCDSVIKIDKVDPQKYEDMKIDPSQWTIVKNDDPKPLTPERKRRIYFIHGLGGTANAWTQAALACQYGAPNVGFPKRKCETTLIDYANHDDNLLSATTAIRQPATGSIFAQAELDRNGSGMLPEQAIIIAHSQGGVVTRQLMDLDLVTDKSNSSLRHGMNYGGVVTIASPLQGAAILSHINDIQTMASDACKKIASATIKEELPNLILPLINNKLNVLMDGVCGTAANTGLPMIFNAYYKNITKAYTTDYSNPNNRINALNSNSNNADYKKFPKMAFYAMEPQNTLFWRTMNWMVNNPNQEYYFDANDDWRLYNSVKKSMDTFQLKKDAHDVEAKRCHDICYGTCWLPFVNIFTSSIYSQRMKAERAKSAAYADALEWFNNVNTSWKYAIGALELRWIGIVPLVKSNPNNDGVVLAESAMGLPSPTHKPVEIYPNKDKTRDIEKGSSHMQVRNDRGLKDALKNLFEGKYDRWFLTPEETQP